MRTAKNNNKRVTIRLSYHKGILISVYCLEQKHSSCFSDLCECKCHSPKNSQVGCKGQEGKDAKYKQISKSKSLQNVEGVHNATYQIGHSQSQVPSPSSFDLRTDLKKQIEEEYIHKSIVSRDYVKKNDLVKNAVALLTASDKLIEKQKVNDAFNNSINKLKNNLTHYKSSSSKVVKGFERDIEQRMDECCLVYSEIFGITVNKAKKELKI